MAYMSQEKKASLAPAIKKLLKEYNLKGSLGVHHHSTLVLNITEGPIDFIGSINRVTVSRHSVENSHQGYIQVNDHWLHEHFDGTAREFLMKVRDAMNVGNHDRSDAMVDHFDVGWYVSINVGKWDKPYKLTS